MTAPSTAAEKQGRGEPGAGGAARGSRLPARQSGKKNDKKKKKKRRGWYKIVRQSRLVRMVGQATPAGQAAAQGGPQVAAGAGRPAAPPLAPVAPAAGGHDHAGAVHAGHRGARVLPDPADLRRPAAEQGEVRDGPGIPGPDRGREQRQPEQGADLGRDREQLPVPDRAGAAGRQRQQQQLHRGHRGQPVAGRFPGLHRRRGRWGRPRSQHPVGPVGQRAGRTDALRDGQGLLRADHDRVHARPRRPARPGRRYSAGQLLPAVLPVPDDPGAADAVAGPAHAGRSPGWP